MRSDPDILDFLNEALTAELTAINQYILHAKMCQNWGYERIGAAYRAESIEEMGDAERLMERILMLDGLPNVQRMGHIKAGANLAEQLAANHRLEEEAVERYRRGVVLCLQKGDAGTRELIEELLIGEENHLDWLETQQSLIRDIGLERYQQSMIGEVEA